MTIYSIKLRNEHKTIRTQSLHEARSIAKQEVINHLIEKYGSADKCPPIASVNEKMFVYSNETQIVVFVSVAPRCSTTRTYSCTIHCNNVSRGGYDFDLHKEMVKILKSRREETKDENC